MPRNVEKLFEIIGLDKSKLLALDVITQFSRIIIPDECFFCDMKDGQRYFTSEYRNLINEIRLFQKNHFIEDKSSEKIYFSYASYVKGKVVGEKKLENFFENQGYKIVYPEKYTLEEQLNMLANCHYFASTIGSCSHNLIFLPKYANVILIPRSFYLTGYQIALDQVIDLNIYYVDSSMSVLAIRKRPWEGPFYYYVSENLINYFGVDQICDGAYYRKQLGDFKRYMKSARAFSNFEERYMPEYYGRQFAYCMQKLSDAHPCRRFAWMVLLLGPSKIKRTLNAKMEKLKKVQKS